ncbi:MAG: hypothetical protein U0900_23705 [Myxococcota bacterium]
MGCDWVAIRNLVVSLSFFVGFATTSAMFAWLWNRYAPGGPWRTIVAKISYSAAATWCATALVLLAILMSTLRSYCACTAAIAACATACSQLTPWLPLLLGALFVLAALCFVAIFDVAFNETPAFEVAHGLAVGAVVALMITLALFAAPVVSCQP